MIGNQHVFVRGVYKLKTREGDANSPVVYYDGCKFWIPGWECPLEPSEGWGGGFGIDVSTIGELLWRDEEEDV